jgi:TonB-dependent SusC/RagA subfamily outer membrane receptor
VARFQEVVLLVLLFNPHQGNQAQSINIIQISHGVNCQTDVLGAVFPQPNDIESIEILKDASATAIYGLACSFSDDQKVVLKIDCRGQLKLFHRTHAELDLLNANVICGIPNAGGFPNTNP